MIRPASAVCLMHAYNRQIDGRFDLHACVSVIDTIRYDSIRYDTIGIPFATDFLGFVEEVASSDATVSSLGLILSSSLPLSVM